MRRVIVGDELWICKEPDGSLVLCRPTVTRADGGGAPGLVTPTPTVLHPGDVIEVQVRTLQRLGFEFVLGCAACAQIAKGEPPPDGLAFQHTGHHSPIKRRPT